MSFILYVLAGFAAGIIGGMGMGGGTILIPALTILFGVNQRVAQAANVIAFLPMAAFALSEHKKNGLLKTEGVLQIIIPAMISTVLGGLLMAVIPVQTLKKLFGWFLIILAVKQAIPLIGSFRRKKSRP